MRSKWITCLTVLVLGGAGQGWGDTGLYLKSIDFKNIPPQLTHLAKDLESVSYVKADFKEKRYLSYLKQPLLSKGVVFYVAQIGLVRFITHPIEQHEVLTSNEAYVMMNMADGSTKKMAQPPELKRVTKIFLNIFSGNMKAWKQDFDIFYEEKNSAWSLGFKPRKKSPLSNFFLKIELHGEKARVNRMQWEGTNKDRTETLFQNIDLRQDLSKSDIKFLFEEVIQNSESFHRGSKP